MQRGQQPAQLRFAAPQFGIDDRFARVGEHGRDWRHDVAIAAGENKPRHARQALARLVRFERWPHGVIFGITAGLLLPVVLLFKAPPTGHHETTAADGPASSR